MMHCNSLRFVAIRCDSLRCVFSASSVITAGRREAVNGRRTSTLRRVSETGGARRCIGSLSPRACRTCTHNQSRAAVLCVYLSTICKVL